MKSEQKVTPDSIIRNAISQFIHYFGEKKRRFREYMRNSGFSCRYHKPST